MLIFVFLAPSVPSLMFWRFLKVALKALKHNARANYKAIEREKKSLSQPYNFDNCI